MARGGQYHCRSTEGGDAVGPFAYTSGTRVPSSAFSRSAARRFTAPPVAECRDQQRAARHGRDLKLQGFTVSQVVHDHGDVCQSIMDLALQLNAPIDVEDFRTLNRCLDDAIASAVTEYGRGNQPAPDTESDRDDQRLGSSRMRCRISSTPESRL